MTPRSGERLRWVWPHTIKPAPHQAGGVNGFNWQMTATNLTCAGVRVDCKFNSKENRFHLLAAWVKNGN